MATRSFISLLYKDNSVKSIYCNNNGYLDYNGILLEGYYRDFNKVNELMNLGDMSVLDKNLYPTSSDHSFFNKEENVCIFYTRDRGEDPNVNKASYYKNFEDFLKNGEKEEYNYVFKEKNCTWYLLKNDKLNKLNTLLKKLPEYSTIEHIVKADKEKKMLDKKLKSEQNQKIENTKVQFKI